MSTHSRKKSVVISATIFLAYLQISSSTCDSILGYECKQCWKNTFWSRHIEPEKNNRTQLHVSSVLGLMTWAGWFQWKVSGEMKPIRCLLFPCGSHILPTLQFLRFKFTSSRQLCSGRNDLRRLILEKRASCQWFHYTLARLQRIWTACESWSYLHPPQQ